MARLDVENVNRDKGQVYTTRRNIEDIPDINILPVGIKKLLDGYVISQDDAKKLVSTGVYYHYKTLRFMVKNNIPEGYKKGNVILIGPTGIGKSFLVRTLINKIGNIPFYEYDTTRLTAPGYVGDNAEDIIKRLVRNTDNNVSRASYGVVFLDEIDKLAKKRDGEGSIHTTDAQSSLLKILEEARVNLDERTSINTKDILFIAAGAFNGLEEKLVGGDVEKAKINKNIDSESLISYGMEPELVGRFHEIVVLNSLGEDDLLRILKESKDSVIRSYDLEFQAIGKKVVFKDELLREYARRAFLEKTGARALKGIVDKSLIDIKFYLPSIGLERLELGKEIFEDPLAPIK